MTEASDNSTMSSQVYLSRDQIRTQITDFVKYYLELENVDLTKSSFLSFIINILSTLTSNLLFYEVSVYKEFFLTTAQLPESILNLSAFLGYNTKEASYAVANVLMTIEFGFDDADTTFTLPEGFKFKAGDVEFKTYYLTTINVLNNTTVTITVTEDNKTYLLPVDVDVANNNFNFILPVRQYKINEQEFQIDSDLETYQFTTIDVPLTGKVSEMTVEVRDPNSSAWTTYEEFTSLYLMSSTDYGYVSRRTSAGRKLYFGNGLIGIQPEPGSTVKTTIYETEGSEGNVIASSINQGDRIYVTTMAGLTKIVNYTCTNTSPASGGDDEESTQDIRSNAIANLVALGRLVSEVDYKNANAVIPYSPLKTAPLPVLKRSDVKCNEIQLFSVLEFESELVPTRNLKYSISDITPYLVDPRIPRGTVITEDSVDYITMFDMILDFTNGSAAYYYIMYEITITPILQTTYNSSYTAISIQDLNVYLDSTSGEAIFHLNYQGTDSTASCSMNLIQTDQVYTMSNNIADKRFEYSFNPYTQFPAGDVKVEFTISSGSSQISTWAATVTFRKSLNDFMLSNVYSDSTSCIIYDIPVIKEDYYNSVDKADFELQVLQYMMSSMSFADYRMLTDFVNLKFTNTTGTMINMKYNEVTKSSVIDIGLTSVPIASLGDRYIVTGNEGGAWTGYKNKIAQCIDSTAQSWYFFTPVMDDFVYVTNKGEKYIYTGIEWMVPEYTIPLEIEIEVFKSGTFYGSDLELATTVRDAIIDAFSDRFGSNISIYRSEIIRTVQDVTGVGHCNLIKPESNIFFSFDIDNFTEQELLDYSPEYVYFEDSNITVRVI